MKSKKYDRKTNKKTIKKIQKLIASSPLNPFILHYYESLKSEELNTNREAVIDKINYNNKIISQLKKESNYKKICDVHKEIIKEYIEKLEYENETSREVIRIINLKTQEIYHKDLQKKYNKIFKKKSKPSETI